MTLATNPGLVPQGSRPTPEQLASMNIGTNVLSEAEKQFFIDIFIRTRGCVSL